MTDKADLIREIHEYVTTHGGENTATHLLVQAASAIQTQAAELEAVGAGGVSGPLMGSASPPTAQAEGWISVAERLPAAYVTVLLTIDGKHITTGEYMHNLSCFSWDQHDDETDDSQATHWMPLPPPPTSAEGVEHG